MKIDNILPEQAQEIFGGGGDPPGCWEDPNDDNGGIQIPGGPYIPFPGFPIPGLPNDGNI